MENNSMGELKGRNAVVTGAGSGIGRGIALALAKRGVGVVVADVEEHKARADLRVALAAQVERGTIDRAAVKPQLDAAKVAEANAKKVQEDTLTAAQKAELAKIREAKHAAHQAKKDANGKDGKGNEAKGEGRHHGGHGLNLTPEQKKQIHDRMAKEPAGDRGADRMVDRLDATVPVLTPAQRAELAAKMRRQ